MIKPLIIHPMDLLGDKVGGVETFLKNFIKFAPPDFKISFVGLTTDKVRRPLGKWQIVEYAGKKVRFLPVCYVKDENKRKFIPQSVFFCFSLLLNLHMIRRKNKVLKFNRIESALPFLAYDNKRLHVIHNNTPDILNNPLSEVRWKYFKSFYGLYERSMFKKADKVFVVREDTTNYYKQKYPHRQEIFEFLPTWVDKNIFYPASKGRETELKTRVCKEYSIPSDHKILLFSGRLEGQKNPKLLIDSFREINLRDGSTFLVIVGTGGMKAEMSRLIAKYNLEDKIFFTGPLCQTEIARISRVSDLFLLTSSFEGMPRSLLESLACGIPAVTTNVGECRRVIKNGFSGLLVDKHEPKEIADAAFQVLNDPERFSSYNCLESVKDYDAESVLKKVYSFYRE